MSITLVLASVYMYLKKTPHFPFGMPEVRWLLVARGVGGFFGVFGMYCKRKAFYWPVTVPLLISLHRFIALSSTC